MLPSNVQNYIIRELPESRRDDTVRGIIEKFNKLYSEDYTNDLILSREDARRIFTKIGVNQDNNQTFVEYYMHSSSDTESCCKDLLYGLGEILEDYKNPFWQEQYPNITDRYLRISSIEGQDSYFYDKETDAIYDVDWSEMDDFMAGKLEPKWKSFYDFLEWYYSEEDE